MIAGVALGMSMAADVNKLPRRDKLEDAPASRQELERWMNASGTAFKVTTNDTGRVEFGVSLRGMNEVYPTLVVKLYAEEDYIVSRCELPVFIQKERCDALIRLFDECKAQAPAFTYVVDREKGRAWCESTTPIGLCGDPLHCDGCWRAFVNLAILRVAREIGSCARKVAQIVGEDGAADEARDPQNKQSGAYMTQGIQSK